LLNIAKPEAESFSPSEPQQTVVSQVPFQPLRVKVTRQEPALKRNPQLSELEQKLKENSYRELQQLLKYQRFPRAIALIEGLAERIPQDVEIRQWQAITYQRFGRALIQDKKLEKARIYLKKALKTDPHNRALWIEVERDFRQLEKVY
jgi:tetratricopeptide (TPR) repeat protein